MPSIKTKDVMTLSSLYKMGLALACAGLVACGGGSGTSRGSNSNTTDGDDDSTKLSFEVLMPMQVQNASLNVYMIGKSEPIYSNNNFTGFSTDPILVNTEDSNKLIFVTLSPNSNSLVYDPITDKYTSFDSSIHSINLVRNNLTITLSPLSEAIYQRSLVRSGNIEFENPDISLIEAKHINASYNEITQTLNQAFNLTNFPNMNYGQSIRAVEYNSKNPKPYLNVFVSLGMMQLWHNTHPTSGNSYVALSKNIGIDLRDGYLDGRTIHGDNTSFLKLVTAPKNLDPSKNNPIDIGALQESARTTFGESFKQATIEYADATSQDILNPEGLIELEEHSYYQDTAHSDTGTRLRWVGAGDYRAALGFVSTALCETSIYPCRQGLNADDILGSISDIEYLVGRHQVQNCQIDILATGDVLLTKNSQTITGQINRDQSDNLLRTNDTTRSYLLNIGSGDMQRPHFIQLELQNSVILDARTGYSQNKFPSKSDISSDTNEISSCS